MGALSFSAIEILPGLLDRTKTQTIRPLWDTNKKFIKPGHGPCCTCQRCGYHHDDCICKEPCLKVCDKVKLYWKQRSKYKTFERENGMGINIVVTPNVYEKCKTEDIKQMNRTIREQYFPKLLGEVEITEVFEITMLIECVKIIGGKEYDFFKVSKIVLDEHVSFSDRYVKLSKRDGFKSIKDMQRWFDKKYDLSTPKRFAVYRWKWGVT